MTTAKAVRILANLLTLILVFTSAQASQYQDYQTAYVHMIGAFVLSNLDPIFRMMEEH